MTPGATMEGSEGPLVGARDAVRIIWDTLAPLAPELAPLAGARGRVLAEEIVAEENVPPFDNAAMDGYAVRSEDTASAPKPLAVIGEGPAGTVFARPVGSGEALRIMTGGVVPVGCDAVVQQEWTETSVPDTVHVLRAVSPGHNIRKTGSDIAAGVGALSAGTELRPQEIGLLASLGRRFVKVSPRPVVAVLATGNELVAGAGPLGPGLIRDSNSAMLTALLEEEGCDVRLLGIARDSREELRAKIAEGLACDVLVTAGGVSVGAYDHLGEVVRELGVEIRFWKVNIRPGMPLLFGTRGRTAVFGLPGNPVSAMVTFLQFVRPALRRLKGSPSASSGVRLRAALEHELAKQDGKRHFVRGILGERDGAPVVRTTGPQVSNLLSSLGRANCLIILPEEGRTFAAGDPVEVELL